MDVYAYIYTKKPVALSCFQDCQGGRSNWQHSSFAYFSIYTPESQCRAASNYHKCSYMEIKKHKDVLKIAKAGRKG